MFLFSTYTRSTTGWLSVVSVVGYDSVVSLLTVGSTDPVKVGSSEGTTLGSDIPCSVEMTQERFKDWLGVLGTRITLTKTKCGTKPHPTTVRRRHVKYFSRGTTSCLSVLLCQ